MSVAAPTIEELKSALKAHMVTRKPARYEHSLAVAETARILADCYGIDPFEAEAAGLLHDWAKVLNQDELCAASERYGIALEGDLVQVVGLLHGPVAAAELPSLFPGISDAVFQAIERHTIASVDMSDLDMVVFIADAIEPHRRGSWVEPLRARVGQVSLTELFFQCFAGGLIHVIQTGRYLYPTSTTIYNHYAMMNRR